MKLIFFLINMNLGGTEKSLLNLISNLPQSYQIDILLLDKKGELLNQLSNNVNVREIENKNQINEFLKIGSRRFAINELRRGNIFSFLKNIIIFSLHKIRLLNHTFYGISNLIKEQEENYDVAIAYAGPHNFISFYTHNYIKSKRKYQWIHFDIDKIVTNKNFGSRFYPCFDKIFCVSENAKDTFTKVFPQFEPKTEVFENIVSENLIKHQAEIGESFNDDFNGIRLLTLGRLSEEKGQQLIPAVVKRLKEDGIDLRWYLIGEGKLRAELEEQIKKLKIENELILLGLKINPYAYLKDCDLYVQTSLHEGYGITIHEAKIFNRPVVTTAVLSASNLIVDDKDGLIVPINEDGIFAGVKELLKNEKKRNDFSRFIKKNELQNSNKIEALLSKYFSNSNFN